MNIIEAMRDPHLFNPLFRDLTTWRAWEVYLSALFGLGLTDPKDLELLKNCSGLDEPPRERVRESYVIAGRRSGKSYITALVAAYLGAFKDWSTYLSPGERGYVFVIANDKAQAGIIKGYISGIFSQTQLLKNLVTRETAEQIDLRNGVSLCIKTCSFRGIRGYTLVCAILEELAFYRSDESANPDREVLAAIRPALSTIPESLLIGISTPYARQGVLWDQYRTHFGKPGGSLIWTAPTPVLNPTIDQGLIARAVAEDPAAARAEWFAEWRSDIEGFIGPEAVDAVTVPGRRELPYVDGLRYQGYIDPSGGSVDSFTLGIAHRTPDGKAVLDVLRERRPPFQPSGVVAEFSELLKAYKVTTIKSDHYAGAWVGEAFTAHGIKVTSSDMPASEYYRNLLPLLLNGTVELLDVPRLKAQLVQLERRTRAGGKDMITHPPSGHDDVSNSAAAVLVGVAKNELERRFYIIDTTPRPANSLRQFLEN